MFGGDIGLERMAEACWLLSMDQEEAARAVEGPLPLRWRYWLWRTAIRKRTMPRLIESRKALLVQWLAEQQRMPRMVGGARGSDADPTPWALNLLHVLCGFYHFSRADALNLSLAEANWWFCRRLVDKIEEPSGIKFAGPSDDADALRDEVDRINDQIEREHFERIAKEAGRG